MTQTKEIQRGKACTKCKEVKRLTEYGHRTEATDGRESRCLECVREDQRARMRIRRAKRETAKSGPPKTFGADHLNIKLI